MTHDLKQFVQAFDSEHHRYDGFQIGIDGFQIGIYKCYIRFVLCCYSVVIGVM